YWMDQDYERALEQFDIASRLSPSNGDIGRLIAAIKRRQGKWRGGLEAEEKGAKIDSPKPKNIRELIFINTAMRRWPEAAAWAKKMRAMAPASLVAKVQSGYVDFWWKGDTRLIKSLLSEVPADVDPDGAVTSCRWDAAMLDRDYATAGRVLEISSLNEVSYTNAGSTPKTFLQGCICLAQGDNETAPKAFETARPSFDASVKEAPLS